MTRRSTSRLGLAVALLLAAGSLPALAAPSGAAPAEPDDRPVLTRIGDVRLDADRARVRPRDYAAYRVDLAEMARTLDRAPAAAEVRRGAPPLRVEVPGPDGRAEAFAVQVTQVMEPALAARHPELRTYAGRGIQDPTRTIRLDLTPMGLHASVRGPGGAGAWYVDPAYDERGTTTHLSYYGADVPRSAEAFVERDLADTARTVAGAPVARAPGAAVARRTYRLAFLTDPTYAKYFGSANVLAEKVTLVNRINQVYNDDLAIRLLLVDGTDRLNLDTAAKATGTGGPCGLSACFAASHLEECSSATLDRTNWVLGQLVGADAYDIGHIGLGVSGGGIAGLGVVGTASKASGCTGVSRPQGDFYAVDYVAHELGHQFGGNHTFDGTQENCSLTNRNGTTSVEPGSGSSVMAYAGICGQDDLQPHSDPYFSQRSIDEITETTTAPAIAENEVQTVSLRGFDADGDSVTLTYPGQAPVTLTRGSADYTLLGVTDAVRRLTGFTPQVSGYDGGLDVEDGGFQLTFGTGSGARGRDVSRLGIGGTTGGVTAFVGVQVQGGPGGNQGTAATTGNHAPVVTAPADRTIPVRTPFTLTGSGTDADGHALTYLWEQNDTGSPLPGGGTALVSNTKTSGPLFRVFGTAAQVTPTGTLQSPSPGQNRAGTSPSRTFPDLAQVLAGNTNAATGTCPAAPADPEAAVPAAVVECYSEFLPTSSYGSALTGASLDFRLTARDGFAEGGGTAYDDVVLTLDREAGPFLVTSRPVAGNPAVGGGAEPVTWAVNGTDATGLAPQVRILLSTDGGQTYPHVLSAATPNDGAETVTLPGVTTSRARIRVEAVGNYFFDVSDADFAITAGPGPGPDPDPEPDTMAPDTTITQAPDGFATGRPLLEYAGTEPGDFVCSLDGAARACPADAWRLPVLAPGVHVVRVAARDAAGNTDPTPAAVRFAVPLTSRQLTRTGDDWVLRRDRAAYRGAFLRAASRGAVLTQRAAGVTRIALVVGTGPGYGRVGVYLKGQLLRRVSLASASPRTRVLVPVATLPRRVSGQVRIKTLNGKPVRIEGLGLL
ncbi:MAG TPA: M12 family metallo-peptidase [Nocardioides sp.]|nr:M12 family metallo-peptidase [Nocardioides sp.]